MSRKFWSIGPSQPLARRRPRLRLSRLRCTLLIIRLDLDLKMHRIRTQLFHTHLSPNRLMIGHPLPVVLHDAIVLRPDVGAVRDDLVDLRPAFTARVPEIVVDVLERLVDLLQQVPLDEVGEVDVLLLGVPTT